MSDVVAFHVPRGSPLQSLRTRRAGAVELSFPDLSPESLAEVVKAATRASARLRAQRRVADVLPSLAAAAERCAASVGSEATLQEALAATTRLSLPMIEHGVPRLLAAFTAQRLRELVEAELGSPEVLDERSCVRGVRMIARGPAPAVHFAAGNVPGLAIPPLLLTLLVKGAAIVKPSMREPLLAARYAQALADIDPDLGECCAVLPWEGESRELNRAACELAEVVTVTGSEPTVRAVKGASSGRVLAFGPRDSIAVVGQDTTAGDAAEAMAIDIALYDQRGCLSPSAVYVEGTPERGRELAAALARALEGTATRLPPGQLSLEEAAAVRRFRDEAKWKNLAGHEVSLWLAPSLAAGSVVWEPGADYAPAPGHRCVRVRTVSALAEIESLGPAATGLIEAVGADGARTRDSIHGLAAALGASRVCPLGRMQDPSLRWPQGGRPRLGDLLRWTVLEEDRRQTR